MSVTRHSVAPINKDKLLEGKKKLLKLHYKKKKVNYIFIKINKCDTNRNTDKYKERNR